MTLNIVNQLRFARAEFKKGFTGVTEEDGIKRLLPINSMGWIVGHLAWHEQFYWLTRAQAQTPYPEINDLVGFQKPASTPSISSMADYWEKITSACDDFLDGLTQTDLEICMVVKDQPLPFNIGTMLSRVIYHYWYHNGEMQALRQLMNHQNLPDFVSDDIETVGSFFLDK